MPEDLQLEIYRPIKSNYQTQSFGENKACARVTASGRLARPVFIVNKRGGVCTNGYGDFYKLIGMDGHNGDDFGSYKKEGVYHAANFEGVAKYDDDVEGGLGVDVVSRFPILRCTEPACGEIHYIKLRTWHHHSRIVANGATVKPGDLIALANSTGASSGHHVHTAPKWCDENGKGIHTNNGFYGAFTPDPYFKNVFILDELAVVRAEEKPAEQVRQEEIVVQLTFWETVARIIFGLKTKVGRNTGN